ncbi:MAG TPA: Holliday junction branch migration protein RuvA [Candidatus Kerfeldbacteria bacterium]|nr:MAG: Holliday junction ATP-dependent DNA helicase RuvA [Parcubacteria group bacterium GW2011_GWA2_48_9]HCJ52565.1 Holliday junction branch migration protein RuvA [Candidatus Kerfeldbacteria bacterium]HCM68151.1 Holliday junction branch migration protein RuvA [Candidatus Kerfeldbacteria bacterium]
MLICCTLAAFAIYVGGFSPDVTHFFLYLVYCPHMIAYLSGIVKYVGEGFLVVETHGVGYRVVVPRKLSEGVTLSSSIEVFTHLEVNENMMELYGFSTTEEVEIFKRLLTVTSIGPKTALSILQGISISELIEMISRGDATALVQLKGIGKKTAERLVLELQHVFSKKGEKKPRTASEEVDALVSLGYSLIQAHDAIGKVPRSVKGVDARVKAALKTLAKA